MAGGGLPCDCPDNRCSEAPEAVYGRTGRSKRQLTGWLHAWHATGVLSRPGRTRLKRQAPVVRDAGDRGFVVSAFGPQLAAGRAGSGAARSEPAILTAAVDDGLIPKNPCAAKSVTQPRAASGSRDSRP